MHCRCWAWRSEGLGVQLSVEILPSMLRPPVQFQKLQKEMNGKREEQLVLGRLAEHVFIEAEQGEEHRRGHSAV